MKTNKAAWRALREPMTFRQAAKLLRVGASDVELMVRRLDLLTIEVKHVRLIPACELERFRPRD